MSVIDALNEGQVRVEDFRDELGKVRHVLDNTDAVLGMADENPSSSRGGSRRGPTSHAGYHRRCCCHHGRQWWASICGVGGHRIVRKTRS